MAANPSVSTFRKLAGTRWSRSVRPAQLLVMGHRGRRVSFSCFFSRVRDGSELIKAPGFSRFRHLR